MEVVQKVFHYTSFVIACLFFLEVCLCFFQCRLLTVSGGVDPSEATASMVLWLKSSVTSAEGRGSNLCQVIFVILII